MIVYSEREVVSDNKEIVANSIIEGDCLSIMKNIRDKSVDMILCDLPYG